MSFLKVFSFKNLGHYIAVAARDIVKAAPVIQKEVQVIGDVVSIAAPALAPSVMELERASNAALGYLVDASQHVVAVADGTNTLTIQGLTAAEIGDFQNLASYFRSHAYANGVTLPLTPAPVPNAAPVVATQAVKVITPLPQPQAGG
ncbi:MAG TPA: hypothetical protein VHA06_08100 [Candidatus Angelobacter sp.]|jgi:hypothetical protein|nr:hypothetical protein [Candidatus Angelobacter sp.]